MDCIEARRTQLGCVHSSDNQPWFTHWEDVNHDFTMYFFDGSSTVKTMQNKGMLSTTGTFISEQMAAPMQEDALHHILPNTRIMERLCYALTLA